MASHTARYTGIAAAAASVVAMGIFFGPAAAPATMSTPGSVGTPASTAAATPGPVMPAAARVVPGLGLGSSNNRGRPAKESTDGALVLARDKVRPLPGVPGARQTVPLRNNNGGQIAGTYVAQEDGEYRGYLMTGNRVTVIEPEDAKVTVVTGINDSRRVVGAYIHPDDPPHPVTGEDRLRGFVWHKGNFTRVAFPGALSTSPYEINNGGVIVGDYIDARSVQHGFVYRNGVYKSFDAPGATDIPGLTGTRILGVNDQGDMVGSYGDDTGTNFRPWAVVDGEFADLLPPDMMDGEASGIENQGLILIKVLVNTGPKLISFKFDGSDYDRIELPNRCDTAAVSINDLGEILVPPIGAIEGTTCPGA